MSIHAKNIVSKTLLAIGACAVMATSGFAVRTLRADGCQVCCDLTCNSWCEVPKHTCVRDTECGNQGTNETCCACAN